MELRTRDTGRTNNFLFIRRLKDFWRYPASPCNPRFGLAVAALRTVKAGIAAMTANAAQRSAEHDKRHTEAMQRHDETMQRLDRNHAATMRALETLIERTAPAPAGD